MSSTQLRIVFVALLFVVVFIIGFWLSRTGKPYNMFIVTIHKLAALMAVVILATTIYAVHRAQPLNPTEISVIILAALCFVTSIITGGLVSIDKTMPMVVSKLHQITPYLTVLSTAASLVLLQGHTTL